MLLNSGSLQKDDADGFEALGSPDTSDGRTLTPPGAVVAEQTSSADRLSTKKDRIQSQKEETDAADAALQESIRGLFILWTLRRSPSDADSGGKERFMDVVREALA